MEETGHLSLTWKVVGGRIPSSSAFRGSHGGRVKVSGIRTQTVIRITTTRLLIVSESKGIDDKVKALKDL